MFFLIRSIDTYVIDAIYFIADNAMLPTGVVLGMVFSTITDLSEWPDISWLTWQILLTMKW